MSLPRLLFPAFSLFLALAAPALAAPVARWEFGAEETSALMEHGGVHRDVPGARPPEFPDMDSGNLAVQLDGKGARFTFADPGQQSNFDFTNGDTITVEAWVRVDDLKAGENSYIIGKGRTAPRSENQNWALRVREAKGNACVSFLFATPRVPGTSVDAHWHRWTTSEGFKPGSGWHHIAVSYRFGEPESARGWIDGQAQPGAWDMGGPTKEAPVVDDDEVWIGSSMGGSASNSFRGLLDSIALHREPLDDKTMAARYRHEGAGAEAKAKLAAETAPEMGELPTQQVLMTFHEGMPAHNRWLNENETLPPETTRSMEHHFLLPRLPLRYDEWGIRDGWKAPVLTRLASEVKLPAGTRRFLLRARGLSRLWVNGAVIARTKPLLGSPSGEEPITPLKEPPLPGMRPAGYRMQEVFGEATIGADGKCQVILETLVGGKKFRAEPGELTVAVQSLNKEEYFTVGPAPILLADASINIVLDGSEKSLSLTDDLTRRATMTRKDEFWKKRHTAAQTWLASTAAPAVPAGDSHPIDAFLNAKIQTALAESAKSSPAEAKQFHSTVMPVLREECIRCHGDKDKGGLRLHKREEILKAGDSENPAVVPGDPAHSELMARIKTDDADERMPPKGDGLKPEQIAALEDWIKKGAAWPAPPISPEEVAAPPAVGDAAFLRRLYLDTVGLPPTEEETRAFLADPSPAKRTNLVNQLLDDPRRADHWMSYWQDVLAENPSLLNASLNTTGPFRWFLHDALRDHKPMDRLVTELILLRGSPHEGGSAGFGIAGDNQAPFAAKGHIVATAFLGIELQCARCHDSPFHSTKQRDLYALAAMFERKPVTVPKSSTVPLAFFEKKDRPSLIKVTLKPGEAIAPKWPFAEETGSPDDPAQLDALMQNPADLRERLAALVTAPQNTRFAQVIVNRVWRRLMGAGFVEPAHDWEGHPPSHPELLAWLAREFVAHGYDLRHIERLILTSQAYQRPATGKNLAAAPDLRFFNMPERRRLTAEQVVDSLFTASGQPMQIEPLTFDPDARRAPDNRISLGEAHRAWQLANLANERDRPSLSLPRARAVTDVLEAFGWTGARQNPRTDRETDPNVLQPGVLANSTLSVWLTRAAHQSVLADLAVEASSPKALVESVFLRFLSRPPSPEEAAPFEKALANGFGERLVPADHVKPPPVPPLLSLVTWSNHLRPEANTIQLEWEKRAKTGPPPDPRLQSGWREVYEDFVWSIMNNREFVWVP